MLDRLGYCSAVTMDERDRSGWSKAISSLFAAIFMVVFLRRRQAQLGPRIVGFLRGRGPTSVDEIREHLGLGSFNGGDVRAVLTRMQNQGLVVAVEPGANDHGGTKYRLPDG